MLDLENSLDRRPSQNPLSREAELFASLSESLWPAITEYARSDKVRIGFEVAGAAFLGVSTAYLSKNPAALGEALSHAIPSAVSVVGKIGVGAATVDWAQRLGVPAYKVWTNPSDLHEEERKLAANVGSGLVDYGAMGFGGICGAGSVLGTQWFKLPGVLRTSDQAWIGKDGFKYRFRTPSITKDQSWHGIYESQFPENERQPYEFLNQLATKNAMPRVSLQLTESKGKTAAFSITSDFGSGPDGQVLLMPYIAVDSNIQSSGIGTQHLEHTLDSLKRMHPTAKGMILEMESPDEPGISNEALAHRTDRQRFWTRNGAKVLDQVKYQIPSSIENEPSIPMNLAFIDFGKGGVTDQHLKQAVSSIYRYGYDLDENHPLVRTALGA